MESRFHVALPVWITTWDEHGTPRKSSACTLDVSYSGARIAGVPAAKPGDILLLRRLQEEAMFQVRWAGRPGTAQRGQIAVECIEKEKTIWDVDFEKLEEEYEPVAEATEAAERALCGEVELRPAGSGAAPVEAELNALSLRGCCLRTAASLPVGSLYELQLEAEGMRLRMLGILRKSERPQHYELEWRQARRGDLPLLRALLNEQPAMREAAR